MSETQLITFLIALICLILLSAFFSLSETALIAVNRYRLRHKARMKNHRAILLLQLLKRPDRVLSMILIGNTFANILASSISTLIAMHFWGEQGALFSAVLLTFIILIVAEIAPKTVAILNADRFANWVGPSIRILLKIGYPIVWLANTLANRLLKIFRVNVIHGAVEPLGQEELRSMVHETSGKISQDYQNMLLTILDLNTLTVNDVMVPQRDMAGIDISKPWKDIVHALQHSQLEWLPVYSQNINLMKGVLHVRDMVPHSFLNEPMTLDILIKSLRTPYYVPEKTQLQNQLTHFQQADEKIAFVVDEYGEILGVLTLNDILEEIVGNFTIHQVGKQERIQFIDNAYLVDGIVNIRDFNRISSWALPLNGPKTISGLITEFLQALPQERTCILVRGYPIEILQVEDNRVKLAKIFPQLPRRESDE